MSERKFPNESAEYREARNALLLEEQDLVKRVKALAAKRRELPLGGKVDQDYLFAGANAHNLGQELSMSSLFGDKNTLILYSFMYGDGWDKPCPSCTSLIDTFDRATISVSQDAAFVVASKTSPERIKNWADERGWSNISLVSAANNSYLKDYFCQGETADDLWPILQVFKKQGDSIHHFWGTEMMGNHVDTIWPYWNIMDLTPEGRPDLPTPPQNFRSKFLEDNYLNKKD